MGWWKIPYRKTRSPEFAILSRDLHYAKYNLCGFVKDDVDYAEIAQIFFFLLCFYVSIINKIVCLSLLNSLTIEIYVFLHTYVFFYFYGLTVNKVAGLTRNSKIFSTYKLNPRKCRSSRPEVMYIKYISQSSCLQIFFKSRSSEKCHKIFR